MVREELYELVHQIESMVGTVAADTAIADSDMRLVLGFFAKMALVVDQAFSDVLAVLIELKYLTPSGLAGGQATNLRKQLDLVTSRSRYRDAEEICSRLHNLSAHYRDEIGPLVAQLDRPLEWHQVLRLIDEHEGRIIELVRGATGRLGRMLADATPATLSDLNRAAGEQVEVIKTALGELRYLSSEIMGLSGRAGFLELAADRSALATRTGIMVGISGDTYNLTGDFREGVLNIRSTLDGVRQSIGLLPRMEDPARDELTRLVDRLNRMLQAMPREKREEAEAVAESARMLVEQAAAARPNRALMAIIGAGLQKAARPLAALIPELEGLTAQIAIVVGRSVGLDSPPNH